MEMRKFIEENCRDIDAVINAAVYRYDGNGGAGKVPDPAPVYDNDAREDWIANDESLYNWARSEGVTV